MQRIMYFCISGNAYFAGAGLLLIAIAAASLLRWRLFRNFRHTWAIVAGVLVAVSGTPLPWWGYVGWLVLIVGWLVVAGPLSSKRPKLTTVVSLLAALASAGAIAVELPYHIVPHIAVEPSSAIYVIGDSVSSPISRDDPPLWPTLLGQAQGIRVVNVAEAGATVSTASRTQAGQVPDEDAVVLLEIGGNNLLGGTSADEFRQGLERLLEQLHRPGRQLVMLELPLPPFKNGFGRAQRDLAAKCDVILIPKKVFARVITPPENTIDGIHLSRIGHQRMAQSIGRMLQQSRPDR